MYVQQAPVPVQASFVSPDIVASIINQLRNGGIDFIIAKIISNVNKKLDYLIIGEKPTTRKINDAKKLQVKVINQEEWSKMLDKTD